MVTLQTVWVVKIFFNSEYLKNHFNQLISTKSTLSNVSKATRLQKMVDFEIVSHFSCFDINSFHFCLMMHFLPNSPGGSRYEVLTRSVVPLMSTRNSLMSTRNLGTDRKRTSEIQKNFRPFDPPPFAEIKFFIL